MRFLLLPAMLVALTGCAPEPDAGVEPQARLSSSEFLGLLPEGEEKRRFILDCTGCHQFDAQIVGMEGRLKSQAEWQTHIERMLSYAGAQTSFPVMSPSRDAGQTAAWLTASLGAEASAIPAPEPAHVEAASRPVHFTEWVLPDSMDLPHDIEPDPAGRIVITGQLSGRMYVLDPESGAFSRHEIPVQFANPRALSIDETGVWWVLLGGPQQIARFDPVAEDWRFWDIGMHPHSIVREGGGRIWFNGHFTKDPEQIGALDPATDEVRLFDVPSPVMPDGGTTMPYGLRQGPDGILWGTQLIGGRLIRFDPRNEDFRLYELPTTVSGPRRPDVGSDGIVWIPEYAAGKLAGFDPATEQFSEYELPISDALPYVVRSDAERGWVWIGTAGADALLRFYPDEERFDVYPLPTARSLVRHMALDRTSGDLWLSYGNFPAISPKIVRVRP